MAQLTRDELLKARVHFGHLANKWNPKMAPFIFGEKNGVHIIDLNETIEGLEMAKGAIANIVQSGRKIMFVATKKQAKKVIAQEAERLRMPYTAERWPGGTLTNFMAIRKSIKKLLSIDKTIASAAYKTMAKKEQLMIVREKNKLDKVLKGLIGMTKLPGALFVVGVDKEHVAVNEARSLGIPVFAIVDTNVNPESIDFPIPANDDAAVAIELIVKNICGAIEEGLEERKKNRELVNQEKERQKEEAKLERKQQKENVEGASKEKEKKEKVIKEKNQSEVIKPEEAARENKSERSESTEEKEKKVTSSKKKETENPSTDDGEEEIVEKQKPAETDKTVKVSKTKEAVAKRAEEKQTEKKEKVKTVKAKENLTERSKSKSDSAASKEEGESVKKNSEIEKNIENKMESKESKKTESKTKATKQKK